MSFGTDMELWAKKSRRKVVNARRIIIIKLFSAVVLDTPVDTGRARGNWIFSKDAPTKDKIDQFDKTGAVAISLFIDRVDGEDGVVYLINSLPYIARLEYDGWSAQAPAGMVRKNVAKVNRFVSSTVREVK